MADEMVAKWLARNVAWSLGCEAELLLCWIVGSAFDVVGDVFDNFLNCFQRCPAGVEELRLLQVSCQAARLALRMVVFKDWHLVR